MLKLFDLSAIIKEVTHNIIRFENDLQKSIYQDFLKHLTIETFHLCTDIMKKVEPGFDVKAYKKGVVEIWFDAEKQILAERAAEYNNRKRKKLAPEDVHIEANKNLTTVKNAVESLFFEG